MIEFAVGVRAISDYFIVPFQFHLVSCTVRYDVDATGRGTLQTMGTLQSTESPLFGVRRASIPSHMIRTTGYERRLFPLQRRVRLPANIFDPTAFGGGVVARLVEACWARLNILSGIRRCLLGKYNLAATGGHLVFD